MRVSLPLMAMRTQSDWLPIIGVGRQQRTSSASNWAFLLARTRVSEEKAREIISVLIDLGKIDADLWEKKRVLWVENFLKNLAPLYSQRRLSLPEKPLISKETPVTADNSERNPIYKEFTEGETPKVKESKVKESKVKESKVKESKVKIPLTGYIGSPEILVMFAKMSQAKNLKTGGEPQKDLGEPLSVS